MTYGMIYHMVSYGIDYHMISYGIAYHHMISYARSERALLACRAADVRTYELLLLLLTYGCTHVSSAVYVRTDVQHYNAKLYVVHCDSQTSRICMRT